MTDKERIDNIIQKILRTTTNATTIIGITGNIASGKTHLAKIFQKECKRLFPQKSVQIISTDDFLQSNQELISKKLYSKKGFPESYRTYIVRDFISSICNGNSISIPHYDHKINDINSDSNILINNPDILIIEGLIVLQPPISPILDGSIFIEANMSDNFKWFKRRCNQLNLQAQYQMNDIEFNRTIIFNWEEVNQVNYFENVLPFKLKATFRVKLDANHHIRSLTAN